MASLLKFSGQMSTFCDTCSIFIKCSSFVINDEVMQYQKWNLRTCTQLCTVSNRRSEMLCSPLCQSTSICNVRTRAKQRYSDISAIKRDIIHNAPALWAPSHTQSLVPGSPLISMNIVRGLSSHCARHKCLDFLSARRHSVECCFSRKWGDLTISKSTNWGEKWSIILLYGKHLTLLREVSYVLCKVGW